MTQIFTHGNEMEEDRSDEHISHFLQHFHNLCNIKSITNKIEIHL